MSKFEGIISPDGEKMLAKLADEKIEWKNPILEAVDGKMFLIVIKAIDNNLLERIPEEWQSPVESIIEAAINEEWELAGELVSEFANTKIDIPFLDEESEALLFNAIISLALGLIMGKVEEMRK